MLLEDIREKALDVAYFVAVFFGVPSTVLYFVGEAGVRSFFISSANYFGFSYGGRVFELIVSDVPTWIMIFTSFPVIFFIGEREVDNRIDGAQYLVCLSQESPSYESMISCAEQLDATQHTYYSRQEGEYIFTFSGRRSSQSGDTFLDLEFSGNVIPTRFVFSLNEINEGDGKVAYIVLKEGDFSFGRDSSSGQNVLTARVNLAAYGPFANGNFLGLGGHYVTGYPIDDPF